MARMKKFIQLLLVIFVSLQTPTSAESQDFESLFQGFDSRSLTQTDKRFLQTALAFEGHYNGLLDGDWGTISRRALQKYSRKEFGTDSADWHMATLAWSFFERFDRDGWGIRYFPPLGMSVLWPEKRIIRDADSDKFINFQHSGSSLSISMGVFSGQEAENLHDYTLSRHGLTAKPYLIRKPNLAVSSATSRDGSTLYTRSDYVNGGWSTIMLSVNSGGNPPIFNGVQR